MTLTKFKAFLMVIAIIFSSLSGYELSRKLYQEYLGMPVITVMDYSGCDKDRFIDHWGLRQFLLDRGFRKELRLVILPLSFPSGGSLADGEFKGTTYGARITLNGGTVDIERFDDISDHEFGHMDQWLKVTDDVWLNQTDEEDEEYAESFNADHDLFLITYDIPTLKPTEEGSRHESIFYRTDSGTPTLFVLDENHPEDDITVIVDGEVRTAKPLNPEGWHIIEDVDTTITSLVIHDGNCSFLESMG